jgi:hypothetical protein
VRFFALNTFCFDVRARIFGVGALVSPRPEVYKDQRTSVGEFSDIIYNGFDRGPEDRAGFGNFCSGFLRRKPRFLPISGVRGISGLITEPGTKSWTYTSRF